MLSKQKENLINCQMYFQDILGYKSYFKAKPTNSTLFPTNSTLFPTNSTLFPTNSENELLVLEVGSAYDMIKYMDNKEYK